MRVLFPLVAMLLLTFPEAILAADAKSKPNVILIMADDFGYECVTANGSESYRTPNLDKLAATGVRFEHCHVQPLCTPTRVQLMTGKYNVRNYFQFGTLLKSETTFGNVFAKAGYATGIAGKWQLGRDANLPQHFGFSESYLWQYTRRPPRYANPGLEHNGKEIDFNQGEYGPKLVNDFALDFVTRHKTEPFFLYYPMILTHSPFQPTPDSPNWNPKAMGEAVNNSPKHFADMTEYMDKMIGELVAKLGELGIRENTMLVFLGDNGTGTPITSRFAGKDYKGGKGTTTAHGTHVPLIVNWPARIAKPAVNRDLISSVDFFPTICEAAGIEAPRDLDGVSFLPQLVGGKPTPREWLYHWYSPRQSANATVTEYAFDHRYKLYRNGRFFDLTNDPLEKNSLKAEEQTGDAAKVVAKLRAAMATYAEVRPKKLDEDFAKQAKKPAQKK